MTPPTTPDPPFPGTALFYDPLTTNGWRKRATGTSTSSGDTAAIRAWAKANGHPVSDRGRIHQSVKDAYYAAQN